MLSLIKRVFDRRKYTQSSLRIVEGSGRGDRPRPFSYEAACRSYVSWIYAAATINANAVSALPLRLYQKSSGNGSKLWATRKVPRGRKAYLMGDGPRDQRPSQIAMSKAAMMDGEFEEVDPSHPLLELLRNANGFDNGFDQSVLRVVFQELTGNAFMHPVIDRRLGVPSELWLMPPQWTTIIPDQTDWIRGYYYGRDQARQQFFETDEVIHFRRPNPNDQFYGLGKVEAGWWAVSQNASVHAMDLAMFDNNARPDYLVSVQGQATRDQLDRFSEQVNRQLRGRGKTGQFLTVTGAIDVKPLSFPPKDLAGREDIVEEIAAVFGVPVSMLKANDPNRASAGVGFSSWREMTILPIARMDEQVLNARLLPLFDLGDDAFLAYDNPVPKDEAFNLQRTVQQVQAGIITRNEARAEDGYEQVDGGDELLVSPVLVPLDQTSGGWPARPFPGSSLPQPGKPAPASPSDNVQEPPASAGAALPPLDLSKLAPQVKEIVLAVEAGTMPRDAGIGQLTIIVGLTMEQAEAVMGSAGEGPREEPPDPNEPPPGPQDDMEDAADAGPDGTAGGDSGRRNVGVDRAKGAGGTADALEGDGGPGPSVDAGPDGAGAVPCGKCGCGSHGGDGTAPISQKSLWLTKYPMDGPSQGAWSNDDVARMTAVIESQVRAVLRRLQETGAAGITDAAVAGIVAQASERMLEILRPIVGSAMESGAAAAVERLSALAEFNVDVNPHVAEAMSARMAQIVRDVNGTTQERIVAAVQQGMSAGESTSQIAARIREVSDMSRWRAEAIARTESAMAYGEGQRVAWKESGQVAGMHWLLAPDACEFCEAVAARFEDGREVLSLDTPAYRVGDQIVGTAGGVLKLDYRDVYQPPLHVNCRCDVLQVIDLGNGETIT